VSERERVRERGESSERVRVRLSIGNKFPIFKFQYTNTPKQQYTDNTPKP